MKTIIKYEHWGKEVSVFEHLKGKHKEHCLCWICEKFNPNDRDKNCKIASENYALCVKYNVVTPVWECPEFEEKESE